jgi:hypothetical protein
VSARPMNPGSGTTPAACATPGICAILLVMMPVPGADLENHCAGAAAGAALTLKVSSCRAVRGWSASLQGYGVQQVARPNRGLEPKDGMPAATQYGALCGAGQRSLPATAWAPPALAATADESPDVVRRGERGDRR